jgi:hypothetical protein
MILVDELRYDLDPERFPADPTIGGRLNPYHIPSAQSLDCIRGEAIAASHIHESAIPAAPHNSQSERNEALDVGARLDVVADRGGL